MNSTVSALFQANMLTSLKFSDFCKSRHLGRLRAKDCCSTRKRMWFAGGCSQKSKNSHKINNFQDNYRKLEEFQRKCNFYVPAQHVAVAQGKSWVLGARNVKTQDFL